MSTASAIIVIVKDLALLRSITFALNAHGQAVEPFSDWATAAGAARKADCVVLDGCLPPADIHAGLMLSKEGTKIVLLTEGDAGSDIEFPVQVLSKPLKGSDIADAVATLRGNT